MIRHLSEVITQAAEESDTQPYYSALGYSDAPVSSRINALAKWVQWAQTAITSGANDNEEAARYNLTQFWAMKQPMLPSMTPDELAQANKLDIRAHGLLVALDEALITGRSPSYWSFLKAFWVGGTPERPDTPELVEEAKQAAADAAKGAQLAGHEHEAQVFANMEQLIDKDVAEADALWAQPGVHILGVPVWAWVLGAIGLYVVVNKR